MTSSARINPPRRRGSTKEFPHKIRFLLHNIDKEKNNEYNIEKSTKKERVIMIKKQLLTKIIVSSVSSVLLGLLLILLPTLLPVSKLISICFIVFGVITIINYIPSLITGLRNITTPDGIGDLIGAIFGITIGAIMIFYQGILLTVLAAVFLIALPLLRVLFSRNHMAALRSEILRIILGIVLIAFLPALVGAMDLIVKIILTVIGSIIILAALINGYNGYRLWKNFVEDKPNRADAIFVDSTGDGVVDSIMIDTTGDGKADTEIKYRHSERNKKK